MNMQRHLLVLAGTFLASTLAASAVVVPPTWDGSPGSTHSEFRFASDTTTPSADAGQNDYGLASALVTVDMPSGTGWQDPGNIFDISGRDGAWDVGQQGEIAFSVPFADDGSLSYLVDVVIEARYYVGTVNVPQIGFSVPTSEVEQETVFDAPDPILGNWYHLRWQGRASFLSTETMSFLLEGNASVGSLVDDVNIFTYATLIPEPRWLILTAILMLGLWRGWRILAACTTRTR